MQSGKAKSVGALIDAAVRGELSRAQVLRLCKDNPEVITLALLGAAKRIAEQDARITELEGNGRGAQPSPSTPSGMVPIYTKPNTPKRRKKPGARNGHKGVRRKTPERIDERKTHRLKDCPCCGGRLQRCERSRTRIIEDIPEEIHPVVTRWLGSSDLMNCAVSSIHSCGVTGQPSAMPNRVGEC